MNTSELYSSFVHFVHLHSTDCLKQSGHTQSQVQVHSCVFVYFRYSMSVFALLCFVQPFKCLISGKFEQNVQKSINSSVLFLPNLTRR